MAAPVRRWGWHALRPEWARRVVGCAPVRPGDLVLDLGAGEGALTRPLLGAGARVLAVELHPRRAARLRETFAAEIAADRVRVVERDLHDLRVPARPYRVVANPPYAAASAVVGRITARGSALTSAHLVLPVPVAHGWTRRLPARFEARVVLRLPPTAFDPPAAPAAVLAITRR